MKYFENYETMKRAIDKYEPVFYEEIMGINFENKIDILGDRRSDLVLDIILSSLDEKSLYLMKLKFYGVTKFNISNPGRIYLTRSLIIRNLKESGRRYSTEYYVHDDSGYGEDDGYKFIEFYCRKLEFISIEKFEPSEELISESL